MRLLVFFKVDGSPVKSGVGRLPFIGEIMRLGSIIILLLIVSVFSPLSSSVPSPQKRQSSAPSKRNLKELLGEPVKCPSEWGEGVCFDKNNTRVIVQFDSSDIAKSIEVKDHCVGIHGIIDLVNQIVPKSKRGKFLKRIERQFQERYVEEYKYLTMEYYQDNSRGCIPAAIVVVWKR